MKLTNVARGATACVLISGAVLAAAGPAAADPPPGSTATVVGASTATTQEMMQSVAFDLAVILDSWDAVKPLSNPPIIHDPIRPKNSPSCPDLNIPRPYGPHEGVIALLTFGGCFDFTTSDIGPGPNWSSSGQLQYVPLAQDAVTVAAGHASSIVDTFTGNELAAMYQDGVAVVKGSRRYVPQGGPPPGPPPTGVSDISIHLLVPWQDSGVRWFFAAIMGFDANTLPAWVSDHFTPTGAGTSQPVWENDGTAVTQDGNAIVPFSVAQYIAQSKGHNDRRADAALQAIDGVEPIANGRINPAFRAEFKRDVYTVIRFLDTMPGGPNPAVYQVFVNRSTPINVCNAEPAVILEFGFTAIPNCGEINPALRAYR